MQPDSPVEFFVSKLLSIVSRLISVERGHASSKKLKQSPLFRNDFKLVLELVFMLTSRELSMAQIDKAPVNNKSKKPQVAVNLLPPAPNVDDNELDKAKK